ncbi:hypothetical protein, partial [Paenibacillus macerans]|uniref:hypothetical protein n=1 Tax=Paenibacillus macerans TaxID=44252 RepID=UPI00228046AD
ISLYKTYVPLSSRKCHLNRLIFPSLFLLTFFGTLALASFPRSLNERNNRAKASGRLEHQVENGS